MTQVQTRSKERGIPFSAKMIAALRAGRKTQTRRLVNNRHIDFQGSGGRNGPDWNDPRCWGYEDSQGYWYLLQSDGGADTFQIPCPYGKPGDRLWVKEGLHRHDAGGGTMLAKYTADNEHVQYTGGTHGSWLWKNSVLPSIYCPRKAARFMLELTDVRVQRLNDISGDDVLAEGVDNGSSNPTMGARWENMQQMAFAELWDRINGAGAWRANPWVWVLTFKLLEEHARAYRPL